MYDLMCQARSVDTVSANLQIPMTRLLDFLGFTTPQLEITERRCTLRYQRQVQLAFAGGHCKLRQRQHAVISSSICF